MAVLAINFSAAKRRKLGIALCFVHVICAACGVAFMGLGIYIKIRISAWLTLVDGYNDNFLPLMMVIVGSLLVVVDVAGAKLVLSAKQSSRIRFLLIPYLAIVLILGLCILVAGIICFVHRQHLSSAFHRGLIHALQQYKDNNTYKTDIDLVQIEFRCCGNKGYEDWFDVQWVNNKYIDLTNQEVQMKMTNGQFLNDDVPFSCCDPRIGRNCIHHHIHDNNMHYNYDYRKDLTVHPKGCKKKLMEYYSFRIGNVGAIVMVMFVLQICKLIGLRYLQTALHNSALSKDPEADSQGWLVSKLPSTAPKKADGSKKDSDVERGDVEGGDVVESSDVEKSGAESNIDSFDSDSFDSDEDDVEVDHAQLDRISEEDTAAKLQEEPLYANLPFHEAQLQDEPLYANLPFHEDKDKLQTVLDTAKKSKQDSPHEKPKKSSKKASTKSSKKESIKSSKKKTSKSTEKETSKKKGSSSKKEKLAKTTTGNKKASAKSSSTKEKTPKSKANKEKSTKMKMKNKNNNIEDSSEEVDDDSDSSGATDTTPLLRGFYSSSEEENILREMTRTTESASEAFSGGTTPEVTWLLSRTQFYSTPPSNSNSTSKTSLNL